MVSGCAFLLNGLSVLTGQIGLLAELRNQSDSAGQWFCFTHLWLRATAMMLTAGLWIISKLNPNLDHF